MGAQQMKLYDDRLLEHISKHQNLSLERIAKEIISQQSNAVHNQSVSSPEQSITVADFAKIKIETPVFDDNLVADTLRKKIKKEYENNADRIEEYKEAKDNSAAIIKDNCAEFEPISLLSVDSKEELLTEVGKDSGETVIQNDACPALSCTVNAEKSAEAQFPFQSEVVQGTPLSENSPTFIVFDNEKNKNNLLQESENTNALEVTNSEPKSTKLVKNPLAFLRKICDKNRDQAKRSNIIKTEPAVFDEEFENSGTIKVESELQTISLNELVIKSEYLSIAETNEDTLQNNNLYQTCLSCNLDSSLDVNLSHAGTDLDEVASKKSIEDVISTISIKSEPESSKYFSTYEISSEEDNVLSVQKHNLNQICKTRKKQNQLKNNINKKYNPRKTLNFHKKSIAKHQQGKRLGKPKNKKLPNKKKSQKDFVFKPSLTKHDVLKKLPKTAIKTRKSTKKSAVTAEFPQPFQLKNKSTQKHLKESVELPKPIMIKREFTPITRNKQSYLRPELQPFVRLKRLKSDELLVPIRTKQARRTRKFKGTSETRHDFLIQQAYSLNPNIKWNRLSVDHHDPSLFNEQRYAASCSILAEGQDEPIDDISSRYFSPQDTYTFLPSSTPDGTSMFSGPIDSGVSTSTPSTSHHHNLNKSLLLEIAAERAFINNHLLHFGHSPIQFDLYNNLNELTIFLKFLLGNLKPNSGRV